MDIPEPAWRREDWTQLSLTVAGAVVGVVAGLLFDLPATVFLGFGVAIAGLLTYLAWRTIQRFRRGLADWQDAMQSRLAALERAVESERRDSQQRLARVARDQKQAARRFILNQRERNKLMVATYPVAFLKAMEDTGWIVHQRQDKEGNTYFRFLHRTGVKDFEVPVSDISEHDSRIDMLRRNGLL